MLFPQVRGSTVRETILAQRLGSLPAMSLQPMVPPPSNLSLKGRPMLRRLLGRELDAQKGVPEKGSLIVRAGSASGLYPLQSHVLSHHIGFLGKADVLLSAGTMIPGHVLLMGTG